MVFGLWGISVLAPAVQPVYAWLSATSVDPPLRGPGPARGRTILTAAIVLAVMVLPIITAISREVFLQTPRLHEEAALALGATRWEMIKMAVLPFGRPGIISAVDARPRPRPRRDHGRRDGALSHGEVSLQPVLDGHLTIAANIALQFGKASAPTSTC